MRSRQGSEACPGSSPSTCTSPPVRWRYPSRISTVVVFPAPFGPKKATISPRWTSRSMPRTASIAPYDMRSPRTLIAASGSRGEPAAALPVGDAAAASMRSAARRWR